MMGVVCHICHEEFASVGRLRNHVSAAHKCSPGKVCGVPFEEGEVLE